jgi:hypothetical protein
MTKAKARQRAKANAGKSKKRGAAATRHGQDVRPGQFDPGPNSIKSPRGNPHTKNLGSSRSSARSR